MFYKYNFEADASLKHLPADIATLSGPGGTNGKPWYYLHRNINLYNDDHTNRYDKRGLLWEPAVAGWKNWYEAVMKMGGWLGRSDNENGWIFGLAPQNPRHIMFRPLKTEAYTAILDSELRAIALSNGPGNLRTETHDPFGERYWIPLSQDAQERWLDLWGDITDNNGQSDPSFEGDLALYASWASHMCRFTISREPIVNLYETYDQTEAVKGRDGSEGLPGDDNPKTGSYEMASIWEPGWGLKYGTRLIPYAQDISNRIHENKYFEIDSQIYALRMNWMRRILWNNELGTANPGVVGVTTAVCTLGARTELVFDTDNYFGMENYTTGPINGEFTNFPTWGGSLNSYKANNTLALSATIFQQHPREDTFFDSEHYAVHHFNKRTDLEGMNTYNFLEYYGRYDEQPPNGVTGGKYSWPFVNDAGDALDPIGLGIREPSVLVDDEIEYLEEGTVSYADRTADDQTLAEESRWVLNVTRVGKLLPYRYTYYGFGVPEIFALEEEFVLRESPNVSFVEDIPENETVPVTDFQNKLLITGIGAGYVPGDVVGSETLGVQYGVTAVDEAGGVTALRYLGDLQNAEVQTANLPAKDLEIDSGYLGGVALTTVSSLAGAGFRAAYVNAEVQKRYKIDQKPLWIVREELLSEKADTSSQSEGSQQFFGIVNDEKEVTIGIPEDKQSTNNEYDVFFHFFNDTNFVWASAGHGDYFGRSELGGFGNQYYFGADDDIADQNEVDEQFVDLRISGR
jgi:hypothetical protein